MVGRLMAPEVSILESPEPVDVLAYLAKGLRRCH